MVKVTDQEEVPYPPQREASPSGNDNEPSGPPPAEPRVHKLVKKTVTEKQHQANRNNSKKSTGPKTTRGKARSRQNGIRRSLSTEVVIRGAENSKHFRQLLAGLHEQFGPVGALEQNLVDAIAHDIWRLQRARRRETLSWNELLHEQGASPNFGSLSEYEQNARRSLNADLQMLLKMQDRRSTRDGDRTDKNET